MPKITPESLKAAILGAIHESKSSIIPEQILRRNISDKCQILAINWQVSAINNMLDLNMIFKEEQGYRPSKELAIQAKEK